MAQNSAAAAVRCCRYGVSDRPGIGRWGNFFNQEAFGTNTALPWGMYSEGTASYLTGVQATLAAQGVTVDQACRYTDLSV